MAMSCTSCGHYSDQNLESCPKCRQAMKMTFLPPTTAVAEPVAMPAPLAPGSPSYPLPDFRGSYDIVEMILRNRFVTVLIALPLILLGFWFAGLSSDSTPRGKYNAIRLGMTPDQVHDILYGDSSFSSDSHRVSTSGDAQMSWSEGPIKIIVYFRNGKVVNKRLTGYDDDEVFTPALEGNRR